MDSDEIIRKECSERQSHQPKLVFKRVFYPDQIKIWKCWFFRREELKPGNPGKKPSEEGENQRQTPPTYGIGSESNPGYIAGGRQHPTLLAREQ